MKSAIRDHNKYALAQIIIIKIGIATSYTQTTDNIGQTVQKTLINVSSSLQFGDRSLHARLAMFLNSGKIEKFT